MNNVFTNAFTQRLYACIHTPRMYMCVIIYSLQLRAVKEVHRTVSELQITLGEGGGGGDLFVIILLSQTAIFFSCSPFCTIFN